MSDTTVDIDNGLNKPTFEKKVFLKSVRLGINFLTNTLMFLIVFVCLLHAWGSKEISILHWHITFCVLGYHIFMAQGTLIMSKYNSWSMFIKRSYIRSIHVVLQSLAAVLVTVGSALMIYQKTAHFNTIHGRLGICALIATIISVLIGLLRKNVYQTWSYKTVYWIKFIHYTTGVVTIFLATGSLCAAFQMLSFRLWIGHDAIIPVLLFISWLFTVLVTMEFWIVIGNKIRNLL